MARDASKDVVYGRAPPALATAVRLSFTMLIIRVDCVLHLASCLSTTGSKPRAGCRDRQGPGQQRLQRDRQLCGVRWGCGRGATLKAVLVRTRCCVSPLL